MPSLTTVDGLKFTFSSKTVIVIADHDASTNEAVTCVYGIDDGVLKISESVLGFLHRLGIVGNFAMLTRPNGTAVWINRSCVSAVRAPLPDDVIADNPFKPNALVYTSALIQRVKETVDQASAALGL